MPENGLLFLFASGDKPLREFSMFYESFIKHTDIHETPIHVLYNSHDTPKYFSQRLRDVGITTKPLTPQESRNLSGGSTARLWRFKPVALKRSPFQNTLYLDCDMLMVNSFRQTIWEEIAQKRFVNGLSKKQCKFKRSIHRHVSKVVPGYPYRYKTVCGGCQGYTPSGFSLIDDWIETMNKIRLNPPNRKFQALSEEIGLGIVCSRFGDECRFDEPIMYNYGIRLTQVPYPHDENHVFVHFPKMMYRSPTCQIYDTTRHFMESAWEENRFGIQQIVDRDEYLKRWTASGEIRHISKKTGLNPVEICKKYELDSSPYLSG